MHVKRTPETKTKPAGGMAESKAQQVAKQDTASDVALHRRHDLFHGLYYTTLVYAPLLISF